jgi:hypothetical protein
LSDGNNIRSIQNVLYEQGKFKPVYLVPVGGQPGQKWQAAYLFTILY